MVVVKDRENRRRLFPLFVPALPDGCISLTVAYERRVLMPNVLRVLLVIHRRGCWYTSVRYNKDITCNCNTGISVLSGRNGLSLRPKVGFDGGRDDGARLRAVTLI